jgi:hypothetical protein
MYWRNTVSSAAAAWASPTPPQPADDLQADESPVVVQEAGRVERTDRHRQGDVDAQTRLKAVERRRRDADDREGAAADRQGLAQHVGTPSEPSRPVAVADHGDQVR